MLLLLSLALHRRGCAPTRESHHSEAFLWRRGRMCILVQDLVVAARPRAERRIAWLVSMYCMRSKSIAHPACDIVVLTPCYCCGCRTCCVRSYSATGRDPDPAAVPGRVSPYTGIRLRRTTSSWPSSNIEGRVAKPKHVDATRPRSQSREASFAAVRRFDTCWYPRRCSVGQECRPKFRRGSCQPGHA